MDALFARIGVLFVLPTSIHTISCCLSELPARASCRRCVVLEKQARIRIQIRDSWLLAFLHCFCRLRQPYLLVSSMAHRYLPERSAMRLEGRARARDCLEPSSLKPSLRSQLAIQILKISKVIRLSVMICEHHRRNVAIMSQADRLAKPWSIDCADVLYRAENLWPSSIFRCRWRSVKHVPN